MHVRGLGHRRRLRTRIAEGSLASPLSRRYLFADYGCGKVFRLVDRPGQRRARADFLTGAQGVTHLDFGPFRRSRALYYVDFEHDAIHRVTYRR